MRLSIGVRMFTGFIAMIVLIATIVALAVVHLSRLETTLVDVARAELPEIQALWQIRTLLLDLQGDIGGLLFDQEANWRRARIDAIAAAVKPAE